MQSSVIEIVEAAGQDDMAAIQALFLAYADSQPDQICFPSFDDEIKNLPGVYAAPEGRLFLARVDAREVGCVAVTPSHGCCELRRLFVVPEVRRDGIGGRLVATALDTARAIGYRKIILSTRAHMADALRLYRGFGFKTMPPPPGEPPGELIWMVMSLVRHRKAKGPSAGPTGRRT